MKTFTKILFTAVLLVTFACNGHAQNRAQNDLDRLSKKYAAILYLMDRFYLDTVNMEQVVDKAIVDLMKGLDPHSYYINKEDYKAMSEPLAGNFDGIGIEFTILEDTLIVVYPLSGGPSEKVGVLSSDRIIKVDGENIAGVGLTNERVPLLLKGPKGTKITITIKRGNNILDFNIVRDKIPLTSLDAAYEIKPGMVYMKLSRFAGTSIEEMNKAFAEFESPKSMILDLRGNGGGFLPIAIGLADKFLEAKQLIVYTEGLNVRTERANATGNGNFKNGNLVVLIDEGSASASEIVAGAVQDWDRGILIGRRSFGKGLVQQEFPLNDGSAVRLTVSRYHTPSGRAIQSPYIKGKSDKYYMDYYERFSSEIFSTDSAYNKLPDSLKYNTLKSGRVVYGGGGVMPDIYIPVDTSNYSKYSNELLRKGVILQFVSSYMDKNRVEFREKYTTFDSFNKSFNITNNLFNQIVAAGEKEGVKKDEEGIKTSRSELSQYTKALIAKDLFSTSEYFQIINEDNPIYLKAIDVLDNWEKYNKEILKN